MIPLAERLRPRNFTDYIGQEHLVGKNASLRKLIDKNIIPSMIFWGKPGTGKTTLANIIAELSENEFHALSAIQSGVKDVRAVIEKAKSKNLFSGKKPILFIDEIHRFSKSQQDSLLEAVEKGWITLIGATTENPSFEVISALLSRCQVFILKELEKKDLNELLINAIKNDEVLSKLNIKLKETEELLRYSSGDARKLLNILEFVISMFNVDEEIIITNENVKEILQENIAYYDKNGEQHYDIISAFIKSIRGSDPNATIYWLAKMLVAGEDIKFLARRMIISASEDIGLANPTALVIANNTFQSVSVVGMPEARIILSQCAIYLANSPKSNASYLAIDKAMNFIKNNENLDVPLHLRNAPTKLMKEIGYGNDYKYAHDFTNSFVHQEYLPKEISNSVFYNPANNPKENSYRKMLSEFWKEKYKY